MYARFGIMKSAAIRDIASEQALLYLANIF